MSNKFDFKSIDNLIVYSKEDIKKIIKELNFLNKKIVDISMVGNHSILDKQFFVDRYNNSKNLSVWDLKKEVALDDFNKDEDAIIDVYTNYPIILKLEDNSTLDLLFSIDGRYFINENTIPFDSKSEEGNNIDISKYFDIIKGKKIIDYKIKDLKPNDYPYIYVDKKKLNGTAIKAFDLILEDNYILHFGQDSLYLLKDKNEPVRMNFFDFLNCIPNYEKYFSKVSKDRYTEEEKIKGKNHKEPEIDCIKELARAVGYNQEKMIELITYLFNNKESVVNNMDRFVDKIKNEYHDNQPSIEEFDDLIHNIFDKK